jgi:hypothetical protein
LNLRREESINLQSIAFNHLAIFSTKKKLNN